MSTDPNAAFTPVSHDLPVLAVPDDGLGNTAWVLGLDGDGVVIDPERDPTPHEAAAEHLGVEIVLAAETHLHADFVTGSRELAARHGAVVAASAAGDLLWPHRAVCDGDVLEFGPWRLEARATPGHSPEHLAYVLVEDGRARAVFSGGSLMVGSVARTDLMHPDDTEEHARALWRSINHQLLALPDDVVVLPTHGAGSFCAAGAGGPRWTTIGHERRSNPLLQADDEHDFVRRLLAGLGTYPRYFTRLREVNRQGPRILGDSQTLRSLSVDEVQGLVASGAVIVDVRSVESYAAGHISGALANTLRPAFASWLGWLVEDPTVPLVLVIDHDTDERELVRQCCNIGYEQLAGTVEMTAWEAAGEPTVSTGLVRPDELDGQQVVDVRQADEFASGHMPNAQHVELGSLAARPPVGGDGPIVTVCGHGERAATAASVLEAGGHEDVVVLDGGPGDWAATTGHQLVRP